MSPKQSEGETTPSRLIAYARHASYRVVTRFIVMGVVLIVVAIAAALNRLPVSSPARSSGCGSSAGCQALHTVSKKYLPLYVAEFEFRYNHRHNPDIFGAAVGCR